MREKLTRALKHPAGRLKGKRRAVEFYISFNLIFQFKGEEDAERGTRLRTLTSNSITSFLISKDKFFFFLSLSSDSLMKNLCSTKVQFGVADKN